jgi:hypothetical protein
MPRAQLGILGCSTAQAQNAKKTRHKLKNQPAISGWLAPSLKGERAQYKLKA